MRQFFAHTEASGYTLKGQQDYLTQTDGEIEQMVHAAVQTAFPNDAFLGEESAPWRAWRCGPIRASVQVTDPNSSGTSYTKLASNVHWTADEAV